MLPEASRRGKDAGVRYSPYRQNLRPAAFRADNNPGTTTPSASPRKTVRIVDLSQEPSKKPDAASRVDPPPADRKLIPEISLNRVVVDRWDDHIRNHFEPPLVNESSFPEADLDQLSKDITFFVEKILDNGSTHTDRFVPFVIMELSLRRRAEEAKLKFMRGCGACFDTVGLRQSVRYEHYLRSTLKLHLLPTDDHLMIVLQDTIVILRDISINSGPLENAPYPVTSTFDNRKSLPRNDDAGEWSTYWKPKSSRLNMSYARAHADVGGHILFLAAFVIAMRECKELQEHAHLGGCMDVLAEALPTYAKYLRKGFLSSATKELIGYKGPNSTWGEFKSL